MKALRFNYFFICLTCVLKFFASAYRPLGVALRRHLSRKSLKRNMRAFSGFFSTSMNHLSSLTSTAKDTSLRMVASSFRGESNRNFDPFRIMGRWFVTSSSSYEPPTKAFNPVKKSKNEGSDFTYRVAHAEGRFESSNRVAEMINNGLNLSESMAESTATTSEPLLEGKAASTVAGFMDYDPKTAAYRMHATNQLTRRGDSWLKL